MGRAAELILDELKLVVQSWVRLTAAQRLGDAAATISPKIVSLTNELLSSVLKKAKESAKKTDSNFLKEFKDSQAMIEYHLLLKQLAEADFSPALIEQLKDSIISAQDAVGNMIAEETVKPFSVLDDDVTNAVLLQIELLKSRFNQAYTKFGITPAYIREIQRFIWTTTPRQLDTLINFSDLGCLNEMPIERVEMDVIVEEIVEDGVDQEIEKQVKRFLSQCDAIEPRHVKVGRRVPRAI